MDEKKLQKNFLTSLKWQEKKCIQRRMKWHQLLGYDVEPSHDPYTELYKGNQQCEFLLPTWQERIFHILPPNFTVVKGSDSAQELKNEYEVALQIARETFKQRENLF